MAGCATTQVSLLDGEDGAETGAVAVLDPKTESDVRILDRANSRSGVRRRSVSTRTLPDAQRERRYGATLAAMPEPPRRFILYFQEATTRLIPESQAEIPALFNEVKRRPGADIQVVGHTDTVGQEGDNDALSIRRADEVKAMLAGLGIEGEIIRATGRGERELSVQTPDETDKPENRRVEVYVK